jgi:hypothetical protein
VIRSWISKWLIPDLFNDDLTKYVIRRRYDVYGWGNGEVGMLSSRGSPASNNHEKVSGEWLLFWSGLEPGSIWMWKRRDSRFWQFENCYLKKMCMVIFAFGVKHDRLYCTQVIDSSVCVCVWGVANWRKSIGTPFLGAVCKSQRPDVKLFCTNESNCSSLSLPTSVSTPGLFKLRTAGNCGAFAVLLLLFFRVCRLFMLSYEWREISLVGETQPPLYHFMKFVPTVTWWQKENAFNFFV